MTASYIAEPASEETFVLAEGPFWDAPRKRVLWVDIEAGSVLVGRIEGDLVTLVDRLHFDSTVGAVTVSQDGTMLVAAGDGLVVVSPDGSRRLGPRILETDGSHRLNDGKTDPVGRFLIGSSPLAAATNDEVLVRLETDGRTTVIESDLSLSNGLAWSIDGRLMYSIDSFVNTIWVRDYDVESGACGPRREFAQMADAWPDGMCVDAEDHLWIAACGAGQVRRFAPDGQVVAKVSVPAPRTTSVAFVGAERDLLLITTASNELSSQQLAEFPFSGRLFSARVDVAGAPVPYWTQPQHVIAPR